MMIWQFGLIAQVSVAQMTVLAADATFLVADMVSANTTVLAADMASANVTVLVADMGLSWHNSLSSWHES